MYIDVQKVLLASQLQARGIYYKTQLCVYNYTIYNKKTQKAKWYLWSECDGDLSSNTFSCMLYDYLTGDNSCVQANTIIVYSGGCSYQNMYTVLSNTMLLFTN